MPDFKYKAKSWSGENKIGVISAVSENSAAELLRKHDLIATSIKPATAGLVVLQKYFAFLNTAKEKDKVIFARQLSTMINAGLPIVQALRILSEQTGSKALHDVIETMAEDIEGGLSFNQALSRFPKVFSAVFISLVKTGEASGNLDETLNKLADQMEKDYELKAKIKGAMAYPAFIIVALVGVMILMQVWVMPQLRLVFEDAGTKLPWTTRILLNSSDIMVRYWWAILIGLGLLIYGGKLAISTPQGRHIWDALKLKIPVFGNLTKKVYMGRFSRTLATLVTGGLPILDSLKIVKDTMTNSIYSSAIDEVAKQVKNGSPISVPLKKNPNFPLMMSHMISVGEQTGQLDMILFKLATFYEKEVDQIVDNLSSLLEPVLMVFLGVAVGFLVISVIMPIYGLANAIQ